MQNDSWLTDTSHSACCPLCSQPLVGGLNSCPACGFAVHGPARASASATDKPAARRANPITPIPARASAQHAQHSTDGSSRHSARSLLSNSQVAHSPEPGWQHESSNYEAVSSLSALSLIIAETPTAPPRTTRRLPGQTGSLEHIDEIDTVPQTSSEPQPIPIPTLFPAFDEIDTLPEPGALAIRNVQPVSPEISEIAVDAASWRTGSDSTSVRKSRRMASRPPHRRLWRFTLLDRVRWWLVRPGHIESLFRVVGAILLFALTFLFAFVIVLNLPFAGRGNFPSSTMPASTGVSTSASPLVAQPTPTLSSPTSTAQAGTTPATSPTASVAVSTPQATATQQNGPGSPVSVHDPDTANPLFTQLAHLNPLAWMIGLCYFLSLLLLCVAALLRRRRH